MGQAFPTDPVLTTHEYVPQGDKIQYCTWWFEKSFLFLHIRKKKYFPRPVRSIILKKTEKRNI